MASAIFHFEVSMTNIGHSGHKPINHESFETQKNQASYIGGCEKLIFPIVILRVVDGLPSIQFVNRQPSKKSAIFENQPQRMDNSRHKAKQTEHYIDK